MSLWVYEARDAAGKVVSGSHDAADRRTALEFLRAQGLFLTRLEAARGSSLPKTPSQSAPRASQNTENSPPVSPPIASAPRSAGSPSNPQHQNSRAAAPPLASQPLLRCSAKDLSLFFRQIGAMIHAGTSLGAALHSMAKNAPSGALRSAASQMEARVLSGEPLSTSMRAFPGLFSPLQIGMVSAGERGGFLERIFERLARYAERDYELQTAIKRETRYPKLLVFASIFIPSVVPLFLGGFNAWLRDITGPLVLIAALYVGWKLIGRALPFLPQVGAIRTVFDGVKLFVPIAGKVARSLATAKFCRALGALYSAGVGPGEAVRLAAQACGNRAIGARALATIPRLEHGEKFTDCMASTGYFNHMALQMMAVGEDSGALDEQLDKAADFLETDSETAIKQAIPVLGMVAFLVVAFRVGSLVIAGAQQYGNMIDEVSQF